MRTPADIVATDRERLRNAPLSLGFLETVVLPLNPEPWGQGRYHWPLVNDAILELELLPKGEVPDFDPSSFDIYFRLLSKRFGAFLDKATLPDAPRITRRLSRSLKEPLETGCLFLGMVAAQGHGDRFTLRSYADSDGTLREADFEARDTIEALIAIRDPAEFFEALHLGYWAQTLAALDTLWTFVFLGLDAGFAPAEIARRASDPRYRRTTQAWRRSGPLEEGHVAALARAWEPPELPA